MDNYTGTPDKISAIRQLMKANRLDAFIIPATDPHLGEYVPDYWRVIRWVTGFTGSAANVVITESFAGLWTDSRYFVQASEQLTGSGVELMKLKIPHTPEYIGWLGQNLSAGNKVGVDGRIISKDLCERIEKEFAGKEIDLLTDIDLISEVWPDRPPMPDSRAFDFPPEYAGLDRSVKIDLVREKMRSMSVDYHLLCAPDDIMWMLNIRGTDINYSPLLTCFAIVGMDQILLFADENKIPFNISIAFDKLGIVILPYDEIPYLIETITGGSSILISPAITSSVLYKAVPADVRVLEDVSIPSRLKSVKNTVEIENIRKVMVKDGVSLTKFFYWLEHIIGKQVVTEIAASDYLLSLRKEQDGFLMPSFSTIAAFKEHGALPHYCPTPETDVRIEGAGIFLLDSGGQYMGGTTDITRSISIGRPTEKQKTDFTLALKGTISLANTKFPYGTRGYQLDILARQALWKYGLNYGHGTGHGVGYCLNVHEGPHNIGPVASSDLKTIIEPGLLISDEPAIYREGEYGFRTENLLLCIEDELTDWGQFLRFETLSLCYIDTSLISTSLLDNTETEWINNYNENVYNKISSFLMSDESNWLKQKTKAI